MADVYTPITGLQDPVTFATKPLSGTGVGSARQQVQSMFDEILAFHNAHMDKSVSILPTVNLDYTGEIASEAMAVSCSIGQVLYLSATGYNLAKADADSTLPCVAMCIETGTGTRKILRRGFIKNTAWAFTVGNKIYVSTATVGAIVGTQPATTGNRVQMVGYAVAADTIYFNPNYVWVEV